LRRQALCDRLQPGAIEHRSHKTSKEFHPAARRASPARAAVAAVEGYVGALLPVDLEQHGAEGRMREVQ
jgi:hypothetical protein